MMTNDRAADAKYPDLRQFLYRGITLTTGNPGGYRTPELALMVDGMSDAQRSKLLKIDCEDYGHDSDMIYLYWRPEVFSKQEAEDAVAMISEAFASVRCVMHFLVHEGGRYSQWPEEEWWA
jgi:hypothetical protein